MYCSVFIELLYTTDKTTVHIQCIVSTTMYILLMTTSFGIVCMW